MSNIVQNLLLTSQKVERALMLWATGTITIEAVKASQSSSKAIALKPLLNKLTGKMSATAPTFNEANWGSTTHASAKLVRQPKPEHFIEIMKIAMSFAESRMLLPNQIWSLQSINKVLSLMLILTISVRTSSICVTMKAVKAAAQNVNKS